DTRRECLRIFCDTLFPSLANEVDPHGFWRRSATELGVPPAFAQTIENLGEAQRAGAFSLLDALAEQGFISGDAARREQVLLAIQRSSPAAMVGVGGLMRLALALCYSLPDLQGRNPNWPAIGYPGPLRAAPNVPKPIQPLAIENDETVLGADVCVIGSG